MEANNDYTQAGPASPGTDFSGWAIIEIMGHQKYSGYVQTQAVGGASMVRVDVPEVAGDGDREGHAAFTKLFGASSIYCLTPVSEEVARAMARSLRKAPVNAYEFPREVLLAMRQAEQARLADGSTRCEFYGQPTEELDDELDCQEDNDDD